jgi:hypothetical protein
MQIQSPEAIELIKDNAKLSIGDGYPLNLLPNVQPVIDMTPGLQRKCTVVADGIVSNTTSGTVYTTPTSRDFYLVSMQLTVIKDVTSTSTRSRFLITVENVLQGVCSIAGITLTAQTESANMTFNPPIKLTRGSAIQISNDTGTANIRACGSIVGFEVQEI